MATKIPLVLNSLTGAPEQLQSGDTISGGGGGGISVVTSLPTPVSGLRGNQYLLEGSIDFEQTVLNDAPTHYYALDNASGSTSVTDLGSGGTNSSSVNSVVFGQAGGNSNGATAAVFDNTTNHGITFTGTNLVNTASSFSIEFAFYAITNAGGSFFLDSASGSTDFELFYNSSLVKFNTAAGTVSTGWTPTTATWYLCEFVYNSSSNTWFLYANGSQVGTGSVTFVTLGTAVASYIGGGGGGTGINGYMQNLSTYAFALTPTQVSNHYALFASGGAGNPDVVYVCGQTVAGAFVMQPVFPGNGGQLGATASSVYAGATTSGPPNKGTFTLGSFIVDQSGGIWQCITAGSPGTWSQIGVNGVFTPCGGCSQASASTALTNGTYTQIPLGNGNQLVGTATVVTTPSYGIKPGTAGTYLVTANVGTLNNPGAYAQVGYGKNGSIQFFSAFVGSASIQSGGGCTGIIACSSTDVINLMGQFASSTTIYANFCQLTVIRIA